MKQLYRLFLTTALAVGAVTVGSKAQEGTPDLKGREFSKIGAGSGTFLSLPVGARATALGAGFAGVADDPSALYWNPAGIMQIEGTGASYMYGNMFAGLTHNFAGVTFPISESYKVGVSAVSFGSGDIERTDMFNQEGNGSTYQVTDLAIGASLAGQLTKQFSFGVTGKFVNLKIADVNASGVAFDVGTMYKPGLLGLRLGFAVQNLSAPFQYTGSGLIKKGTINPVTGNRDPDTQLEANTASLPLAFRAGISSDLLEGNEEHALLVNTEFSTTSDSPEHLGLGAEYVWNNLIAARVGYQFGSSDGFGLTGGIGVRYDAGSFGGMLDYAIRPHPTLGLVNQVSASIRLH